MLRDQPRAAELQSSRSVPARVATAYAIYNRTWFTVRTL